MANAQAQCSIKTSETGAYDSAGRGQPAHHSFNNHFNSSFNSQRQSGRGNAASYGLCVVGQTSTAIIRDESASLMHQDAIDDNQPIQAHALQVLLNREGIKIDEEHDHHHTGKHGTPHSASSKVSGLRPVQHGTSYNVNVTHAFDGTVQRTDCSNDHIQGSTYRSSPKVGDVVGDIQIEVPPA